MKKNSIFNIYSLTIILYLIFKPFYVFKSGLPQPSDMFLAVSFGLLALTRKPKVIKYKLPKVAILVIKAFMIFIIYQFLVNFISGVIISNIYIKNDVFSMLKVVSFSLFNLVAVLTIFMIYERIGRDIINAFLVGTVISLLVTYAGILLSPGSGARQTGTFNNPNQLGYYGVIMFVFCLLGGRKLKSIIKYPLLFVSVMIITMSGSKAGIIGIIVMFCLFTLINVIFRNSIVKLNSLFLLLLSIGILVIFFGNNNIAPNNRYLNSARNRLESMDQESDNDFGTGRGYDRIIEIGPGCIFGVGEGAFFRFTALKGGETHSTYATLIVSYGLVGMALWLSITLIVIFYYKKYIMISGALFSGIFLYWFTHQGMRNTLFWILLAYYTLLLNFEMSEKDKELPDDNTVCLEQNLEE